MSEPLLLPHELAAALKISERQVKRLVADGAPRIKVSDRLYRFDLAAVLEWLKARAAGAPAKEST